jgi:hypothetical protein
VNQLTNQPGFRLTHTRLTPPSNATPALTIPSHSLHRTHILGKIAHLYHLAHSLLPLPTPLSPFPSPFLFPFPFWVRNLLQAEEAARQKEQEKILNRPKKLSMSLKKSGGLF